MAMLGPMVVVAETPATDLLDVLEKAGAFPIVETGWADAPAAITEIQPVAVAIAEPAPAPDPRHMRALRQAIETRGGPVTPVIARLMSESEAPLPDALPVALEDPPSRLVARLRSALRIRTVHATVLRQARAENAPAVPLPQAFATNLLDDATVLCVGRGSSYPALSVAIGERVGLIGTLSVETAARYLVARDIEGVVIGDGLGPRVVEALLTALAEDERFRDLPVGLLDNNGIDDDRLPNLVRIESDPELLVERLLPMVRLQAFEAQLRRTLKALEAEGALDPATGLLGADAFWRDLERAIDDAEQEGRALTVARFSFEDMTDQRANLDAARLLSRLIRNVDFACRENDGSIIAAFTETDLRSAHVVVRRLAGILRQTMLSPGRDRGTIRPTVTLATLKASDNLSTLVARVGSQPQVAAASQEA
ncbi:MAG: GGDEF domain-containing protein [Xanthobacteraceae bacterium]